VLSLEDRSAHPSECSIFRCTPVEQDLLAAMLSPGPVGIDPHHSDPMPDEALAPSSQVLHAVIGPLGCSVWGDDVWLIHGASSVGSEESVDHMCLEVTFWSLPPQRLLLVFCFAVPCTSDA
jgi:hypothetical protein